MHDLAGAPFQPLGALEALLVDHSHRAAEQRGKEIVQWANRE
jgi:hypothetical protein